uniref:Uncharacterized protein n=1 Tax=Romanomermis culicivorax TaxID=13658 RepID=A0A915IED1_ROMCU
MKESPPAFSVQRLRNRVGVTPPICQSHRQPRDPVDHHQIVCLQLGRTVANVQMHLMVLMEKIPSVCLLRQ